MKCFLYSIAIIALPLPATGQGITCRGCIPALDSTQHFLQKTAAFFPVSQGAARKVKPPVPVDQYTRNFGFFCRQELKMHQAHVPLSFRLGSMEYCNMLEQK